MGRVACLGLVLIMAVLAGCTEDGGNQKGGVANGPGSEGSSSTPMRTPEKGTPVGKIGGIVIDDSQLPIDGAQITERTYGYSTMSDKTGRFLLESVPVGSTEVAAAKAGYFAAGVRVVVEADKTIETALELEQMDLEVPFNWTFTETSYVDCAIFAQRGVNCNTGPDRSAADWNLGDLTGSSGIWFETAWEPFSGALGKALMVSWAYTPAGGSLGGADGPSPLRFGVPAEKLNRTDRPTLFCDPEGCKMISKHGPPNRPVNTGHNPDWFGLTYQQRVDDWVTVFYHGEFPRDFTALPKA